GRRRARRRSRCRDRYAAARSDQSAHAWPRRRCRLRRRWRRALRREPALRAVWRALCYLVIGIDTMVCPMAVESVDLDPSGSVVAGPTQLFTAATSAWDTPRIAIADHRLGIMM